VLLGEPARPRERSVLTETHQPIETGRTQHGLGAVDRDGRRAKAGDLHPPAIEEQCVLTGAAADVKNPPLDKPRFEAITRRACDERAQLRCSSHGGRSNQPVIWARILEKQNSCR
jgi:hypothetical protein